MYHYYPTPWYWYPIITSIGVVVGWLLNVVIHRYPRGESLLYLPYCPGCKRSLSLKENIPIVGYFLAQGKCSSCDRVIPIRYPLVEILTGIVVLYLFRYYRFRYEFYFTSLFFIDLMLIGFIDLEQNKIPLALAIGGTLLGLGFNFFWRHYYLGPLFGFFFGWLIIYLIYFIGMKTEKKEVVGNEEMFLAGMIGAFLGLRNAAFAIFLGAILAIGYGIKVKKSVVPFGPFLAVGALIAYLLGDAILRRWLPFLMLIP